MGKVSGVVASVFLTGLVLGFSPSPALAQASKKPSPADGHTIHVVAPHILDGQVMGPFHHYCKPVSDTVIECLIYDSDEPNALLTQVEYFIAKSVTTPNVPLDTWNKYYHDHAVEIAGGRVKVMDVSDADAAKIAEIASKTDGIVFSLWNPEGAKAPLGEVKHPQAVGHQPMTKEQYEDPKR